MACLSASCHQLPSARIGRHSSVLARSISPPALVSDDREESLSRAAFQKLTHPSTHAVEDSRKVSELKRELELAHSEIQDLCSHRFGAISEVQRRQAKIDSELRELEPMRQKLFGLEDVASEAVVRHAELAEAFSELQGGSSNNTAKGLVFQSVDVRRMERLERLEAELRRLQPLEGLVPLLEETLTEAHRRENRWRVLGKELGLVEHVSCEAAVWSVRASEALAASNSTHTCGEQVSHSERLACETALRSVWACEEFASADRETSQAQENFRDAMSAIFNRNADCQAAKTGVDFPETANDTDIVAESLVGNLSNIDVQIESEPARSSYEEPLGAPACAMSFVPAKLGKTVLSETPLIATAVTSSVDKVRIAREALAVAEAERVGQHQALRSAIGNFHERWQSVEKSNFSMNVDTDVDMPSKEDFELGLPLDVRSRLETAWPSLQQIGLPLDVRARLETAWPSARQDVRASFYTM